MFLVVCSFVLYSDRLLVSHFEISQLHTLLLEDDKVVMAQQCRMWVSLCCHVTLFHNQRMYGNYPLPENTATRRNIYIAKREHSHVCEKILDIFPNSRFLLSVAAHWTRKLNSLIIHTS